MPGRIICAILPPVCDICGRLADADSRLENYRSVYLRIHKTPSTLHICGKCLSQLCPEEPDKRWFVCLSEPYDTDPIPAQRLYMPFPYKDLASRMVPAFKFGGRKELARLAGIMTGALMAEDSVTADIVIPVPLAPGRLKERGYNQASEIARPIASLLDIPYVEDALVRTRSTSRQSELTYGTDRYVNVRKAFAVCDSWDIEGLSVILADDVCTTGFTMHEAAMALYDAGAENVLCVAFAGNRLVKNAEPY